jgi:hypothetical protein
VMWGNLWLVGNQLFRHCGLARDLPKDRECPRPCHK